ncbi:helix-turn-helix domain-containing protein [Nocardia sp. NPDC052112]|uniref:helix-turn-helix domain-containing protein n=1 Tax=Nocardia sp. NPDC052112 TaxID=3155646 RepID=UPI00341A386D
MADTRPSIASYLRERREAAGLTQAAMAAATGFPLRVIEDFEQGVVAPTSATLGSLFDALGVPMYFRDHIVSLTRASQFPDTFGPVPSAPLPSDLRTLRSIAQPAWFQLVPTFDLVAANSAYLRLFPGLEPGGNILEWTMLNPQARKSVHEWHKEAHLMVYALRMMAPGLVPQERLDKIISACRAAPEWERLWLTDVAPADIARPWVHVRDPARRELRRMTLNVFMFEFPHRPWWMYTLVPVD